MAFAALLAGCGSSRPDPQRPIDPALPLARTGPEPDKGQGNLTFHYSNRSTAADLAIDLSSTDVYLEMSGKAAQEQAERMGARTAAPVGPETRPQDPRREPAPAPKPEASPGGGARDPRDPGAPGAESGPADSPRPGHGLHKGPPKRAEPPAEEEAGDYEDVTAKVLTGIRRAQELFYQKRYPEAMQAVRSSLDARATAEGYALQGSIHFMQGQTGMARRQWMEALRLNPDMPAVVNMLEKTRTPGGRGSPSPRPVSRPPARAPEPEAPYPEEYSVPAPAPEPAPAEAAPSPVRPSGPPPAGEADAGRNAAPSQAAPARSVPADPAPAQASPTAPDPDDSGNHPPAAADGEPSDPAAPSAPPAGGAQARPPAAVQARPPVPAKADPKAPAARAPEAAKEEPKSTPAAKGHK